MPSTTEITVQQLSRLIGLPSAPAIVDVRTEEDYAAAPHLIPGSRRRDFRAVKTWAGHYHGRSVIVACQRGLKLSQGVAAWMRHEGIDAQTLEGGFEAWKGAGHLLVRTEKLPARDEHDRTVWVTRARPKVDRIACPWLIRRFVDPGAVFLFVAPSEVLPVAERFSATPFDIDGVFWSHRGETCTFDTMIAEFGLKSEPLSRLAASFAVRIRPNWISHRKPPACSRPRSDTRACIATTSRSSTPRWRCTTPSTGGAATRRRKRTTGRRPRLRLEQGSMQQDTVIAGTAPPPTYAEALKVWARIGLLSFGGPAGQIALMHRELVEERKWIDEGRYLNALNFCMLLPGPEAMQLATYVGWRLHGLKGGLTAGLLFVIPGALIVLALSMLYAAFGKLPLVEAVFVGIKAAVLAIVVEALLRIARRSLKDGVEWAIAGSAFVAIFFLAVPFPLIVLAAALIGFARGGNAPAASSVANADSGAPIAQTLTTTAVWLAIWIVPLAALAAMFGPSHVLSQIALFFSKLAVVTFGGAYAVLAYMAQDVVETHRWLTAGEMLDGLGLAETTPGPLILVTEFVGFLAAHRHGGGNPWVMGVLGALVTLWATFAPCFLWIFAGAPYIERLNAEPRLKAALAAVTAAVVGVILNLTVWFALHVLFASVTERFAGPLRLHAPDLASISWPALLLSGVAIVLLFVLHRGVLTTLAVCGALAFAWHAVA